MRCDGRGREGGRGACTPGMLLRRPTSHLVACCLTPSCGSSMWRTKVAQRVTQMGVAIGTLRTGRLASPSPLAVPTLHPNHPHNGAHPASLSVPPSFACLPLPFGHAAGSSPQAVFRTQAPAGRPRPRPPQGMRLWSGPMCRPPSSRTTSACTACCSRSARRTLRGCRSAREATRCRR